MKGQFRLTVVALGLAMLTFFAATLQAQDYAYTINNGAITITRYSGAPVAVIPSEITGLPVTTIGDGAFASPSLTSVTIPNSVTSIGHSAFAGTSLTSVTIPNSVTNMGVWPFGGCIRLAGITVDTLNAVYSSVDGVLFNKSQTTLIQYPRSKLGNYTIPNSVTSIGDWALAYGTNLAKVTIGNSVKNIGEGAFSECTSLTSVTIPNSVTNIGDGAFSSCTSLTNVTIPNSVTSIGNEAFSSCTSVISFTIPNSVTSIGYQAFAHCTGLSSVTIPNSVTYFGRGAFYECTSLTEVYFGGNAWDLMEDRRIFADNAKGPLFDQSPNVTVFYLPGTSGWGTTIGGRPTAQWVLPYPVILTTAPSFGVQSNDIGFIISWATNVSVVVEASTTLANPIWASVSTNTFTDGWFHFSDAEWTNHPSRFYRIRSP